MRFGALTALDPYQVLFPLGIAHAIAGAVVWVFFALNSASYPAQIHAHHMMGGFLLSFATGFLMTAVPRFTGTMRRTNAELVLACSLSISALFTESYLPILLSLLFLAYFFARRMAVRAATPPPHFIFIPLGLLLGCIGAGAATLSQFGVINPSHIAAARLPFFYGMMLSFLLGIGAKLVSAFLGWAQAPTHQAPGSGAGGKARPPLLKSEHALPLVQAALLVLGLIIEMQAHPTEGRSLRAVCATWIALQEWRLHRRPKVTGKFSFWIWVSAWVLIVGLWAHALIPALGLHAAHLIFIGGFGLMTLLVASRVTLAHGGHNLALESTSRIYAVTATLAIFAAIVRLTAIWTPSYITHLAYAAALWILSVSCWGVFFVPRMFSDGGESN